MKKSQWDGLFFLSAVAIIGLIGYLLLVPQTKEAKDADAMKVQMNAALQAQRSAQQAQASIDQMKWKEDAQALASNELDHFTRLAQAMHLQLVAFRSQAAKDMGAIELVPSTLMVQGSFMNVMSLLQAVEAPNSKYSVQRLEITQTGKGDEVSAAFGLGAFVSKGGS